MARERRGAGSSLVSMETPYDRTIYSRCIIGRQEEEYQDNIAITHRRFYKQTILHTDAFTRTLLHTDAFTHRRFYTETLLHRDAFTHRRFYTETLLHTDAFYTQTLWHTNTFAHKSFDTQTRLHTNTFTHRRFYTQTLLHTDAFTHRRFYTQTRLHTDAFTHRRFTLGTLVGGVSFKVTFPITWARSYPWQCSRHWKHIAEDRHSWMGFCDRRSFPCFRHIRRKASQKCRMLLNLHLCDTFRHRRFYTH